MPVLAWLRPMIFTSLPWWWYFSVMASRAAMVDASQRWEVDDDVLRVQGVFKLGVKVVRRSEEQLSVNDVGSGFVIAGGRHGAFDGDQVRDAAAEQRAPPNSTVKKPPFTAESHNY